LREENKRLKNKDIKSLVPTAKTHNKSYGTSNGLINKKIIRIRNRICVE